MKLLLLDELNDASRSESVNAPIFRPSTSFAPVHPYAFIRSSSLSNIRPENQSAQEIRRTNSATARCHPSQRTKSVSSASSAASTPPPPRADAGTLTVHGNYMVNYGASTSVGHSTGEGTTLCHQYTHRSSIRGCESRASTNASPVSPPVNSNESQSASQNASSSTPSRHQPPSHGMPTFNPGNESAVDDQASVFELNDTTMSGASADDRFERSSVNGRILHYRQ